jgi:preprotein translocase subunit SecF
MFIIKNKWIFIAIAAVLSIAAIAVISVKGLNLGIEFTGGSIVEVSYEQAPELETINTALSGFDFNAVAQPFGENGYIIRTRELTEADRGVLLAAIKIDEQVPQLERFNTIGPTIGSELRSKALLSIILVALAIIIFIAFAFRKVAEPVSSWKYGMIAVVALAHDVLIPLGIFALLGKEATTLLVVGLLSIIGLSVNDTIVVFDRTRENLNENKSENNKEPFAQTVGRAIMQTMARSINTSLTLIAVLAALLVFGPDATKDLALVLLLGTFCGTYSSIFLASPLLVAWNKNKEAE